MSDVKAFEDICSLNLKYYYFLSTVNVYPCSGIINKCFRFFDGIFKIILNICWGIKSIRQVKLISPCWKRCFEFIVSIKILIFRSVQCILRFNKVIHLSYLPRFILSYKLRTNLCGSESFLFSEIVNMTFILI